MSVTSCPSEVRCDQPGPAVVGPTRRASPERATAVEWEEDALGSVRVSWTAAVSGRKACLYLMESTAALAGRNANGVIALCRRRRGQRRGGSARRLWRCVAGRRLALLVGALPASHVAIGHMVTRLLAPPPR